MSERPVVQRFRDLLGEAEQISDLPSALRDSEIALQHRAFQREGTLLLAYLDGYRDEHEKLIAMVRTMLAEATQTFTNGSLPDFYSELPPGKAPRFRKARDELLRYLK